jgi:hypothetical protein
MSDLSSQLHQHCFQKRIIPTRSSPLLGLEATPDGLGRLFFKLMFFLGLGVQHNKFNANHRNPPKFAAE